MNVLIIYGYRSHWHNFNDDKLLPLLNKTINKIIIINDINSLKKYLNSTNNTNYILPLVEYHMLELKQANIPALMEKTETIETFSNKKKFIEYAIKHNLQAYIPKTFKSTHQSSQLVIVKPTCGYASTGAYLSSLDKLTNNIFRDNVVQEYILTNTEYAGYLVVKNGNIIHSLAYFRNYPTLPYIKGHNDNSIQKRSEINKACLDIFEKFLKPVNYTGTCCIDYKILNNVPIIFEINPRLGLSLTYESNKQDAADVVLKMIDVFK